MEVAIKNVFPIHTKRLYNLGKYLKEPKEKESKETKKINSPFVLWLHKQSGTLKITGVAKLIRHFLCTEWK